MEGGTLGIGSRDLKTTGSRHDFQGVTPFASCTSDHKGPTISSNSAAKHMRLQGACHISAVRIGSKG